MNVDDEYDHDIGIEMYENRRTKMSLAKQQQKAKQESIRDFKQSTRVQSRCLFCEDSENMPRNMQIAHGYHTFLMLPPVGRLVPGHCVIVPKAHARSTRQVDEDVWEEIRNFRKCLVKMFVAQGKECCFIETAMHLNSPSNRFHAVVECIPLQSNLMAKARMYFKKAMDESESEWSQHNSKKCLEMKPPKNLKTSIPENFPYFVVEFNMSGGYLHAIDEESRWNRDFGIEILGGLLKKNSSSSKKEKLAPGKLEKERREFLSMWEKFDWSKAL
jgi:diadenosine tetraphosphate (Ap4A) HIT family hydrolase